jgi:glucose-1-phosphate thymidylyltransferase
VTSTSTAKFTRVIEKPDDPPSNLVMTGFYMFTPALFHASHLVQLSDRGECDLPDAIDAIRMDGWHIDVGYPEDLHETERRLQNGE